MAGETQETGTGPGRFCRGCGAPLRPGRTFCTSCGRPVAASATSPGSPEPLAPDPGPAEWPARPAERTPERAGRPDAGAGRPDAGAGRPVTGAGRPRGRAGQPRDGAGQPGDGTERPGGRAEPGRLPPGRHRSRGRPLAIGIGGLAAAGLALAIILITHPFSHPAVADSASSTSPSAHTRTSRSAASTSPAASSSPASSTSPATSSSSPGTSSASSSPGLSPAQAARGLAALLASSASDRQQISNAYDNVLACGAGLAQDAQAFRSAAASHRRLLSQLAQLPGRTALPQAMLSDLSSAWRASAAADDDFARWAQDQVRNGCTLNDTSDPNFVAANGPDNQATTSKTAFVGLWNPMATGYGLPNYQQNQI